MTKQALLEQAKQLSKDDQIDLAMDLWDLVDTNSLSLKITTEFAAELDRRIAEADATRVRPWSGRFFASNFSGVNLKLVILDSLA